MFRKSSWTVLTLLCTVAAPVVARAQGLETLGNRASALSAFVAVADDAAAVAWNPAGLVFGPIFNASLDLGRSTSAVNGRNTGSAQAGRVGSTLVAFGVPPLGLSYYRLSASGLATSPDDQGSAGRQDRQAEVRTLVTHHVGVTVLQSLGDYITVGSTLKVVRGSVGGAGGQTTADVDAGVIVSAGKLRAGLVARNLTTPSFGSDAARMSLNRHARAGVAWGERWPGLPRTIVALDADLTRVPHPGGDRRDVALGVERWLRAQQVGVRAGVRSSTVGDARPVVSGGASYAVRAGMYVDGYVAGGANKHRAFGIAGRVAY
ncbi:MAG TPA: hypothetical protein VNJ02_06275 [Vicinamibacterales bacterium]|nr:hypothetical protein [Vicinamibacterales bacterium]